MTLADQPETRWLVGSVLAGAGTAASLLLPWFELSGRKRSSIDLIGSAATLDVIEGGFKALIVGAWLAIPVVVAITMLVAASGRHRLAARLLLPVGPLVALCVMVIIAKAPGSVAWGLWVSLACAALTSIFAALALRGFAFELLSRSSPN